MVQNQIENTYRSAVCLKKAAELTAHIVKHVAGNDVASTINNSDITAQTIELLVLARIQHNLRLATV